MNAARPIAGSRPAATSSVHRDPRRLLRHRPLSRERRRSRAARRRPARAMGTQGQGAQPPAPTADQRLDLYRSVFRGSPNVPPLGATARARLPDPAFAYVDSRGQRRLPIHDASHVRNALARFEQVAFEDDAARERARQGLLRAAKRYGIVPLGFFDGQLRKERQQTEIKARARDIASLPRGTVTFLLTDMEDSTGLLRRLGDGYAALLRDTRALIRASVRDARGR